jgi:hypothetical protein
MPPLWGLRGDDWGQYGEVIFFLQGAFRTKENTVKTFQYVIRALLAKARAYEDDLQFVSWHSFGRWSQLSARPGLDGTSPVIQEMGK